MIFSYMEFKKPTKHSNLNNYFLNNLFNYLKIGFIKFYINSKEIHPFNQLLNINSNNLKDLQEFRLNFCSQIIIFFDCSQF